MMDITFVVPGTIQAKQRPRSGRNGFYTPKETKQSEKIIATLAKIAMRGLQPTEEPVAVYIDIFEKKKSRADIDNLAKTCLDGMNSIVYGDDVQVRELTVRRHTARADPLVQIIVTDLS